MDSSKLIREFITRLLILRRISIALSSDEFNGIEYVAKKIAIPAADIGGIQTGGALLLPGCA